MTRPSAQSTGGNVSKTTPTTVAEDGASNMTSQRMQQTLDEWATAHPQNYRVIVRSLSDEAVQASYKPDVVTVPASTYKLFVAYGAYHQAEEGAISLDHVLGSGQTVEQCIEKAIVRSDNGCAEAIGFYLGWDKIDSLLSQAGFTHTTVNNYAADGSYSGDKQTSAADLAALLTKLHDGSLLSDQHTMRLLGYMQQQIYRQGIPAGVTGAVVADKVGFLPGLTHDAGIVYGPKEDYVLVIMSGATDNWRNIEQLTAKLNEIITQ